VATVALLVLSSGKDTKVPGTLNYDARAKPLLKSLQAARLQQLNQEHSCRGCVAVSASGGGCSGVGSNWACDLHTATGPRGRPVLEEYRVRWNANGCWDAAEDCVSSLGTIRRLCPPAKVEVLQGCIHAAQ
jgi:hypothetical protein